MRGAGVRKGNRPGLSRARAHAAPVRAGLAGRGGAAVEVRTEVDLSLLLVGVLAGAPALLPLGLA